MHEFGTTKAQLGEVALAARKWAQLNPEAYKRDPLTAEDYAASRLVSDPLSVLDCCLVTDGAAAVVMTRADRARDLAARPGLRPGRRLGDHPPRDRLDAGPHGHRRGEVRRPGLRPGRRGGRRTSTSCRSTTPSPSTRSCSWRTSASAPRARAAASSRAAGIAPGGALPVNTNGGGLSCVHPGMYGLFAIIEAVRQLRGEARRASGGGAELALAHGNGGVLSSQATVILGAAETA